MSILEAIFLGAVQGLTEFLPVSSSGHLALFQSILKINTPTVFFDTILHLGTLLAVVFYLRKEIVHILKTITQKETIRLVALVVVATLPAVAVGFLFKDNIEAAFSSLKTVGISFIITALILYSTKFFAAGSKDAENMGWGDSFFVGCFQALSLLPGVSRSGSTISASVYRGLKREVAFKFSFLMAIPAIFGAFVLQLKDQNFRLLNGGAATDAMGFIFSAIFGFISLKIVEKALIKGKMHYFSLYCLLLGILVIIFL